MTTKQFIKFVIAIIIMPVVIMTLINLMPIYTINFILHILKNNFKNIFKMFIYSIKEYVSEIEYVKNLYLDIFNVNKN